MRRATSRNLSRGSDVERRQDVCQREREARGTFTCENRAGVVLRETRDFSRSKAADFKRGGSSRALSDSIAYGLSENLTGARNLFSTSSFWAGGTDR